MKDNLVFTSNIFTPNLSLVIRTYLMGRLTRDTSYALFPLAQDFQLSLSPVCLFQSPPGIFVPENIIENNKKVITELKQKLQRGWGNVKVERRIMWWGVEGWEENKHYSRQEMRRIPIKKRVSVNVGQNSMFQWHARIKWHPWHSSSNSHLKHPEEDLKAKEEASLEAGPTFQPEE